MKKIYETPTVEVESVMMEQYICAGSIDGGLSDTPTDDQYGKDDNFDDIWE